MSIVFFDINKWNRESGNECFEEKGSTNQEKAENFVKDYIEKNELVIASYKVVIRYEDILPCIIQEYKKRNSYSLSYTRDMMQRDYIVYDLLNYEVYTYDYFLKQGGKLDESFCSYMSQIFGEDVPAGSNETTVLFQKYDENRKYRTVDLINDLLQVELLSHNEDEYAEDDYSFDKKKDSIKKKVSRLKKDIATVLDLKWDKVVPDSKTQFEMLQIIGMFYMICCHGVVWNKENTFKKMKVLDTLKKPRKQLLANMQAHYFENETVQELNYLKNQIMRNICYDQINEVNRIYRKAFDVYTDIFNYLALIEGHNFDAKMIESELDSISNSVELCMNETRKVSLLTKDVEYNGSLWVLLFQRYRSFEEKCNRIGTKESLNYVYDLGCPKGVKYFDVATTDLTRYGELHPDNFEEWLCRVSKCGSFFKSEHPEQWIHSNIERVKLLNDIIARFDREAESELCCAGIVLSMAQAIEEVELYDYRYENNYKGYKGNKMISLLSRLDGSDPNGDDDIFDSIWVALVKRRFHYNEKNYRIFLDQTELDINFGTFLDELYSLNSVMDIEVMVEGLHSELSLLRKLKESRSFYARRSEQCFKKCLGVDLRIEDYKVISLVQCEAFWEGFLNRISFVLQMNETFQRIEPDELFHLNLGNVSLEMSFSSKDGAVVIHDMKNLRLGNSYDLYHRALELQLPWFTDQFDHFG